MSRLDLATRVVGVGLAVALLALDHAAQATADTVVPLPGGDLTQTLSDGTVVQVRLDGESADINPSLGATPLHRNAWVSGTAHLDISADSTATGGKIYPGYTVGCQVDISGGGVDGSQNGSLDATGKPAVSGTGGGNLTLGPGQAQSFYLLDIEQPDDFGNEIHYTRNKFSGNSGSVAWSDETIALNGCAGAATARAFVSVEVETDHVISWTTLWGKPFSLG
ncbi:MspA family porin [Nocardia sp. NPDC059240]|uniref:MspA family porin n=1 Tax=Nocardia sp. NPDC059240 TaxID=3346786 RepID=UPI00369A3A04